MVQVTFYIVLSVWDFGFFFYVYYSLLLPTSLRDISSGVARENH